MFFLNNEYYTNSNKNDKSIIGNNKSTFIYSRYNLYEIKENLFKFFIIYIIIKTKK